MTTTRTVLFTLYDGVQSLDLTGPLEVFHAAGRIAAADDGPGAYRLITASLGGGPITTSSGLLLTPDEDLARSAAPHTLVVPGGDGTREPDPALVAALRARAG